MTLNKIWNMNTYTGVGSLVGHTLSINALLELADGTLVSGSSDETVIFWDTTTLTNLKSFNPFSGVIYCLEQISSLQLAVVGADKKVYFFNIATTNPSAIPTVTLPSTLSFFALLKYQNSIVAGNDNSKVGLWDTTAGFSLNVTLDDGNSKDNILCLEKAPGKF